jgi:arrestin-related trafficking adapter 4/5/7
LNRQPMEGIWANKFRYKITMPKSNFAYGTSITTNFDLTPIKKGVAIHSVKLELYEGINLTMHDPLRTHDERDWCIKRQEMDMPDGTEYLIPEVDPDDPTDEGHRFSVTMDLPTSLRKCRQSCNTDTIRIKHWVQVYVNVTNPEGHISQVDFIPTDLGNRVLTESRSTKT